MKPVVLLLDDESAVLAALKRALIDEDYEIVTAESAVEAAGILSQRAVDVIVTDERMPGMCGTKFLAHLARTHPTIVGIVLTGNPTLEGAVRSLNLGNVLKFFTKPCNHDDLAAAIRTGLRQRLSTDVQPAQPTYAQ